MHSSVSVTAYLPSVHACRAQSGAFPSLHDVILLSNRLTGGLPESWAASSAWRNLTGM